MKWRAVTPSVLIVLLSALSPPVHPQAWSTPSPEVRVYQEGELSVDDMVRLLSPAAGGAGQDKGYQPNGKWVNIAQEDLDNCFQQVQADMPSAGANKNFNAPLQATTQQIDLALQYGEGQHILAPGARQEVRKLAAALQKMAQGKPDLSAPKLLIEGHANATGSPALNKNITCRRAAYVREVLRTQYKIDTRYVQAVGYGDTRTLPNLVPTHPDNRRVVVRSLLP